LKLTLVSTLAGVPGVTGGGVLGGVPPPAPPPQAPAHNNSPQIVIRSAAIRILRFI
jgi:hypothetical protein